MNKKVEPECHVDHSGSVVCWRTPILLGGGVGGNAGLQVGQDLLVGLDLAVGLGLAVGLVAFAVGLGVTVELALGHVVLGLVGRRVGGSDHDTRQVILGLGADVDAVVGHLVLVGHGLLLDDRVERELIQGLQVVVEDLALELVPQVLAHLRIAHDVGRHGALENRLVDRMPALLAVLLVPLLGTQVEHLQETVPEVEHHPVPEEQEGVLRLEDLDLQLALLAGVDGHRRRPLHRRQTIIDDLRHEAGNHGDDLAVLDVAVDPGLLAVGIECHHLVVQAELPRLLLHVRQKLTHDALHEHSVDTVEFHLNLLVFLFPTLEGLGSNGKP